MATVEELVEHLRDGRDQAHKAPELEAQLNMPAGNTQEPTRDLIRQAITEDHIPIGSGNSGFFLIDSDDELNHVISDLEGRIGGLRARVQGLRAGWQRRQESRAEGRNWPKP